MKDSVRMGVWDGLPTGKCDHIDCSNEVILHLELSTPGNEYQAECDSCSEHLPNIVKQARAFLLAVGVIEPETQAERNIVSVASEHISKEKTR